MQNLPRFQTSCIGDIFEVLTTGQINRAAIFFLHWTITRSSMAIGRVNTGLVAELLPRATRDAAIAPQCPGAPGPIHRIAWRSENHDYLTGQALRINGTHEQKEHLLTTREIAAFSIFCSTLTGSPMTVRKKFTNAPARHLS